MREEDGNWLLGRVPGKCFGDVVAPELEAEGADLGCRDCVGYSGNFYVEGTDGEVGWEDVRWDEALESV